MKLKKLFSLFVLFIFVFSALLTPAAAMTEKTKITDSETGIDEVSAVAEDYTNFNKKESYYTGSDAKADDELPPQNEPEAEEPEPAFKIMSPETSRIDNLTVSGYLTRINNGTAIAGATAILGTPNSTENTSYCRIPNDFGSNQTTTITDSSGYYELNIDRRIPNAPCYIDFIFYADDYASNRTTITVDSTNDTVINRTTTFPDGTNVTYETNWSEGKFEINRTMMKLANLTAQIYTNLTNEPYTNYGDVYNVTLNVTNEGDVPANITSTFVDTIVSSSGLSITPLSRTTPAQIGGMASGLYNFTVTAPGSTTWQIIQLNTTGQDSITGTTLTAGNYINITTQMQAGGNDSLLVLNMSANATYLNATDEIMEVGVTVWNDGEASALNTNTTLKIFRDADGVDYTSNFTITGPYPSYENITGGNNETFYFNVSTHNATFSGNYTIYAYANATDENSFRNITSNNDSWRFYLDTSAPQITITSPAEGSITGPSAFLNATTSYAANCTFGNASEPTAGMTITNGINHSEYMTNLADGTNTFYVKCTDAWGRSNETSRTWTVDALPPTIIFNNETPAVNGTFIVKQGAMLNFTLYDLYNVSSAVWTNDSITNTTEPPYSGDNQTESLMINTTDWTGNSTVLLIWTWDVVGNMQDKITIAGTNSTIEEINVTVDENAPNVTIITPRNNSWYTAQIPVNVTVEEDIAMGNVYVRWENITDTSHVGNWTFLSEISGTDNWTGNMDMSSLSDGNWTIRINATDYAGNFNDTETVQIQLDMTAPDVTITVPSNNAVFERGTTINVSANVFDLGSEIDPSSNCTVIIEGISTDISYNATNATHGICEGQVIIPSPSGQTSSLTVSIEDRAGNTGHNHISITIEVPYVPGGGKTGGGMGMVAPAQPKKLSFNFTIEPETLELVSNETGSVFIEIKNTGEDNLNNIIIKTYDLRNEDYYTDPTGLNLFPGETGTLELLITPNSLDTGIYTIGLAIGNDRYAEGGEITLIVTNADEYAEKMSAVSSCNLAEEHIMDFAAQGIDITQPQNALDYARTKIKEGEYAEAEEMCGNILALTPNYLEDKTTNPLTGFAVAVGDFAWSNLAWILVASGIVLGSFLGRRKIAGALAGLKKKGKGGAGAAGLKPKPESPKKPEVPKTAPVPETKPEPTKDNKNWQIEWK